MDGWEESAAAWIADMGDRGDFSREFVLDGPLLELVRARPRRKALDVGCGEGRFCRMLKAEGIKTCGIDPTLALLTQAQRRDAGVNYQLGRAEQLPFADESFDLVVSYLTLIDIPDYRQAIQEMARVLQPGGSLLIANLTSFMTAAVGTEWSENEGNNKGFEMDHYLTERAEWVSWRGIHIQNWHRPLSSYLQTLLNSGLILRHFSEPVPTGGQPETVKRYCRVPWFVVMEWEKPLLQK